MNLINTLKHFLPRPQSPKMPRAKDILDRIGSNAAEVFPVLVTGALGSGKNVFAYDLSSHLTADCVVHLRSTLTELPGFEDAPLLGQWQSRKGAPASSADLDDILRERPAGVFELEMPPQAETSLDLDMLLTRTLQEGLERWRSLPRASSSPSEGASRTLTLIIEEGHSWFPVALLKLLVAHGRAWQLRVVLVAQEVPDEHLWPNFGHIVAFNTPPSRHADSLASWLAEPADRIQKLQKGLGLYRTMLGAQSLQKAKLFRQDLCS